ncbi:hypothetical protein [Streptomyces sp. TRM68367]|uniref:hypothetical protein n=1 Tax=Streptomyces sp. TRM68367 TaxID=2758415 RepID=UPI00165C7313|nr:hypothetical protein [Streptomyces sp. TRM68367]MBC9729387.1 hypothetical protein [Streptomyces sp. TRM68367]
MDAFVSINSSLSHGLAAELTVYGEEQSDLVSAALGWLTDGVAQAAMHNELNHLAPNHPAVSGGGYSHVRQCLQEPTPGSNWGFVSVCPQGSLDVLYNPYSPEVVPWLRSRIEEAPESAAVDIGGFSTDGETGNPIIRLSVSFDEELPNYVKLSYHVDEAMLTGTATARDEHMRLRTVVSWACMRYNVVFGHFSYERSGGATELERYLRGPARVPSRNTPQWRERLRGYSWLMVVSGDIAELLGGSEALQSSGAFDSVRILPNGSLLLQATPSFQQYRGEAVRAVRDAVRDVLAEGELRGPSPAPGQPPTHMVLFG